MKLTLTNFRCFEFKRVEIRDLTTLISGPSASGKSSIFMAIVFIFSGEGKKLVQYGKKSCKVVFKQNDTKIIRTKGPNRLIVIKSNTTYEDKDAQSIIDLTFPNWMLGYVPQRIYKSFFASTCAEKLAIIQEMSLDFKLVESIKLKCKCLINERKESLKTTKTERISIESVLKDFEPTIIKKPIEIVENVDLEIEKATSDLTSLNLLVFKRSNLSENKSRLETILNEITIDENDCKLSVTNDQLAKMINEKIKHQKYISKLYLLESIPQFDEIPIDELIVMIKDMQEISELRIEISQLDSLKQKYNDLKNERHVKSVNLTCPICSSQLGLIDNILCRKTNNVEIISIKQSMDLDSKLMILRNQIANLTQRATRFNDLIELYPSLIDENKQLSDLKYLLTIQKNKSELESECLKLKCDAPHSDLIEQIKLFQHNLTRRQLANKELHDVNMQLEEYPLLELENRQTDLKIRLFDLIDIKKYIQYERQLIKIKQCIELETKLDQSLPNAIFLQSLIKRAEEKSLEETIDQINLHASIYIDLFFDNRVSVKLRFDGKINLHITIDENECDIQNLSGGEYARLTLAYAIAMAEMNNVNLLMLDESLSSLDAESSKKVMNAIKTNFSGQVVIIAHQIPKGGFDKVVELDI